MLDAAVMNLAGDVLFFLIVFSAIAIPLLLVALWVELLKYTFRTIWRYFREGKI